MAPLWAALRSVGGDLWEVDGGSRNLSFFFNQTPEGLLAQYVDPTSWRFVKAEGPLTIGARVRLDKAGRMVPT